MKGPAKFTMPTGKGGSTKVTTKVVTGSTSAHKTKVPQPPTYKATNG